MFPPRMGRWNVATGGVPACRDGTRGPPIRATAPEGRRKRGFHMDATQAESPRPRGRLQPTSFCHQLLVGGAGRSGPHSLPAGLSRAFSNQARLKPALKPAGTVTDPYQQTRPHGRWRRGDAFGTMPACGPRVRARPTRKCTSSLLRCATEIETPALEDRRQPNRGLG